MGESTGQEAQNKINNLQQQCGFMSRRNTSDAIFALSHLMEKYREGHKNLHGVFIDF